MNRRDVAAGSWSAPAAAVVWASSPLTYSLTWLPSQVATAWYQRLPAIGVSALL